VRLVVFCYVNYIYAPTPPDPERNSNQARHDTGADKTSGHGLADVYVLFSRTAQSQPPLLTERIRKRLSNKMPAFTKHWAIRATWANGDDKVWQIFQANKSVMSPRCSDYNTVRRHFCHCIHVGQTQYNMEKISRIGISTTGIVLDCITQITNGIAALTARNNMRDYHLITANCQTFVLKVRNEIVAHGGPNGTPVTPPRNTVTLGLMSPMRSITLGSFSCLLVVSGMFPLGLWMLWMRYPGAISINFDLTCYEFATLLYVCLAKMLHTDIQFTQRRSTFACFVFDDRTLMEYVDLYLPARAGLAILEVTSGLFTPATTHLVLKDIIRTVNITLMIQTGFVLQTLHWAEILILVKKTIQLSEAIPSISAGLESRSTSPSGHSGVDAVHAAKHDQDQEHQNLQDPTEQVGKHATQDLVQRRRLTDGERQETSLLVRRMPRRRHRAIVLDSKHESLAIEK
jgi:hypothetical protein